MCNFMSLSFLTRKSVAMRVKSNIMVSWLLWVMLVILGLGHSCSGSGGNRDIFLLGGQSNMAGRGGVNGGKWDGNVPPECRPNPSILRFNAELQWKVAREPLHADIDVGKTCGIGPGMAFANQIIEATAGAVGLVPCAVGGTRITQWSRGSPLYNQLVRRANESLRDGGIIRALLWYQGESDTIRKQDAESYKQNMENFILDLRSDLRIPSLLIIQVALASGEGKFIERVREGQLGIKLPNVKCIDAKGLRLKADKLHLTTMSEGIEFINEEGAVEIKVEGKDDGSSAKQDEDREASKRDSKAVHLNGEAVVASPAQKLESARGRVIISATDDKGTTSTSK